MLSRQDRRLLSRSNFAYTASLLADTGQLDVLYDGADPKACVWLDFSINKIASQ